MKKIRFKMNNGFAASDALIALLIIALFSGLIATVSYNVYLANSHIKRMSKANGYIADIFEYANKIYYDDVTVENLTGYFNNKYYYSDEKVGKAEAKIKESEDEILETPFKISLNVINYNETEGNIDKLDLVKQISITVEYLVGDNKQKIEMKSIKQRENLITPNKPEINDIELEDEKNVYPIKNTNENFTICDLNDSNWYNYENGEWARVLVTNRELNIQDEVDIGNLSSNERIYTWIPRYAYKGNEIVFLYGNSNKFIQNLNNYNNLTQIDKEAYSISLDFTSNGIELVGIWTDNNNLLAYRVLDTIYKNKIQ